MSPKQPSLVWQDTPEGLAPFVKHPDGELVRAAWAPQEGSQTAFLHCPVMECLYAGTRGPGKMCALEEPILTPMGWTTHGEVRPGQRVCAPDGTEAKVTHVFYHKNRDCYRVTFDDGASVVAGDEHLWKFKIVGQARKSQDENWHWNDTLELKRNLDEGRAVLIPTLDDVGLRKHPRLGNWPVEPYMLGLHLGDGHFGAGGAPGMTSVDEEIQTYCEERGYHFCDKHSNLAKSRDRTGIREGLTKLGLRGHRSWEKFVPRIYQFAPREVRLAILQGLMDTDGTVDKTGYCSFGSSSKQLSEDVQWLVRSLGGKATLTKRETFLNGTQHRDGWIVYIQPGNKFNPFRLKRKAARVRGYMHKELCRRVTSIEYVGKRDAACIRLDHPDHLYITRDFIVTHNTDALLMDYAQSVGRGYGLEWRGIIFRRTHPELQDIIDKSKKWYSKIFPTATFNEAKSFWAWPTGERLFFRQFAKPSDYYKYHGSSFTYIAWEELTTWPDDAGYKMMFSCLRSSRKDIPLKVRSTTNPYGVGHSWVKARFRLPLAPGHIVGQIIEDAKDADGVNEPPRVVVCGYIQENKVLLSSDPRYIDRIRAAARNPAELEAWLLGSWDIVSGGMFDDIWLVARRHVVVEPFPIPASWRVDRSFDWGSSRPFSVGWWAESDGTDYRDSKGHWRSTVRGDLFRIHEWYGWNGQPNQGSKMLALEISQGIREQELNNPLLQRVTVHPGPADSSIFDDENGNCVATDMRQKVRINGRQYPGVRWKAADKSPGSRALGWERMRQYLSSTVPPETGLPREQPGLYVFSTCDNWLRTVPALPRSEKKPDDADTEAEDHVADETRYRVRQKFSRIESLVTTGTGY